MHAFLMLCVVGLGASAVVVGIFCLFLDECIGFSMLNEVVVVAAVDAVDAVDVADAAGDAGAVGDGGDAAAGAAGAAGVADAAVDAAVDAVEVDVLVEAAVDAWVDGSRSSLEDGVDGVILMWISLLSTVFIDGVVV